MPLRYGFLSTYPPTQCGLATFTAALIDELNSPALGASSGVVRLLDAPDRAGATAGPAGPAGPAGLTGLAAPLARPPGRSGPAGRPVLVGDLVAGTPGGPRAAARLLNGFDVVVVQHEYGVYGGPDGDEVLAVLDALDVPVIVVLHTVLVEPTPHQRQVLESVVASADAVVVMTETARVRLVEGFQVHPRRVVVIPHGAADNRRAPAEHSGGPTVLTWGLIGPGKGIEWGIAAMADLADLDPAPHYVIAGQTHPKVLAREGEAYREGLATQIRDLGLTDSVSFDDRYLDPVSLAELVRRADVVLLPYDSVDQVTSGVLIEAVAALRPIVATRFPHAVELLGDGSGLLVPHRDPAAIAAAVRRIATDKAVSAGLASAAAVQAPDLLWPAVAGRYRQLAAGLVARTGSRPSTAPVPVLPAPAPAPAPMPAAR